MRTYINAFKQNNDHTRIMRKVGFRSSFKEHCKEIVFKYLSFLYGESDTVSKFLRQNCVLNLKCFSRRQNTKYKILLF